MAPSVKRSCALLRNIRTLRLRSTNLKVTCGDAPGSEETTELIVAVHRLLRQARTGIRIQQKLAAELKVRFANLQEQQKATEGESSAVFDAEHEGTRTPEGIAQQLSRTDRVLLCCSAGKVYRLSKQSAVDWVCRHQSSASPRRFPGLWLDRNYCSVACR